MNTLIIPSLAALFLLTFGLRPAGADIDASSEVNAATSPGELIAVYQDDDGSDDDRSDDDRSDDD
jgi:hypothetical protein